MDPASAATDERVHAEKVQVLARNLPFTALTGLAIALLSAFATRGTTGPAAWQWVAGFIVTTGIRLTWLSLYWRSPERDRRARYWGYSLAANTCVSGLMWLVFGLVSFVPGDTSQALFVAIVQTGLTAASLASLSAYTPAQLAFAIPTMGGFILPYAASGERTFVILAAMACVFMLVITLSSRAAERVLTQSIRLRFDNQRLIDELRTAKLGAETASHAKSDFLAMMSHEIRTPMNAVVAMAELIAQTGLDGEQRSMVSIIRQSADNMLAIIGDILDFSRIEAGRMSVDEVSFDLRAVMEDVALLVAPGACEKDLEVVVDVDPALPSHLRGDPARLRQILLNLAGNAVKFTEAGHVLLRAERSGGEIFLSVEDTGPGIPAEAQPRLFTPFTQVDGAVARHYGGTGLGLSICKRLVELMGGRIAVDSASGQGTSFSVTLPLQAADEAGTGTRAELEGCRVAVLADMPLQSALERLAAAHGAVLVEPPEQADVVVHDGALTPGGKPAVRLLPFHQTDVAGHSAVRKPVRGGELIDAIGLALGRAPATLPAPAERPKIYAPPERNFAETERAVILVAEDNVINRVVLAKMLDRLGLVYDMAEDGQEAFECLCSHDYYGLVLTDFHMPRMDGIALARAIRERGNGTLPIIALTADALPQTARLCEEAGLQGQLVKPLRQDMLKSAIAQWLPRALDLRQPLG